MKLASAKRPARGEVVCGDDFVVVHGESTLIAIADGLGHGPAALEASHAFCQFVASRPLDTLQPLMLAGSQAIAHTRGAAAALVRICPASHRMWFTGVGNIELHAVSQHRIRPVSTAGIVGRKLRKIVQYEYPLVPGDLLLLHTDGISSRLELSDEVHPELDRIVDNVMSRHGKDHDDATCIVVRY
jgi:serine/threonine protein phosphatase PrpC